MRMNRVSTLLVALIATTITGLAPRVAEAGDMRDPPDLVEGGGMGVGLELAATFQTHHGGGYSLAYSPDGKRIATGGVLGDIVVWDAETLQPLRRWHPYGGPIDALQFSPDGKRLVSGPLTTVWDPDTGRALRRFRGGGGAAWDPTGRWFAQGGEGVAIALRDGATLDLVKVIRMEARPEVLVWSRDGTRLAAGTTRGHIVVIDPVAGEVLSSRILDEREPVYAAGFLPDGTVVAASRKGRIVIGDREIPPQALERGSDGISRLAVSPDGARIAFGHFRDGTVRVRDAASGAVVEEHTGLTAGRWIGGLSWSPDGKDLAAIPDGGALRVVREGEVIERPGNAGEVRTVTFDPSGRWAAATGTGLGILDLESGARQDLPGYSIVGPGPRPGELLAAGADSVSIIDAHVGDELDRLVTSEGNAYALRGPWTSPDGREAITGGRSGTVHLSLGELVARKVDTDLFSVIDACWAPDSRWGALAEVAGHHGDFRALGVFRRQDGGLHLRTRRLREVIHTVAIDPTGRNLVAGGYGGLVSFDPTTLEETHRTPKAVTWFRFLAHGVGLAGNGKEVMVWDVDSGETATLLRGENLHHLALSRDGKRLLAGSRYAAWVYDIVR